MAKIFVIASMNMDVTSRVKRHPKVGETVKGSDFMYSAGGKGTNQAIAASRLGDSVVVVGKVGTDVFGKQLLDALSLEKLETGHISSATGTPTGAAFVAVDEHGENSIYVSGGANDKQVIENRESRF